MTNRLKTRLAKLETVIKAPSMQQLSADERAVLLMLAYTRRYLPDVLTQAEAWHARGRPPASQVDRQAAGDAWQRIDRLTPALIAANTRTNELIKQGRVARIIDRLTAWGHWREPDPTPPDVATIMERLERALPDEAT